MTELWDTITCTGLSYECHLGFHDYEKFSPQKITVDLTAWVLPMTGGDRIDKIQFDYHEANRHVQEFIKDKKFNLIETLAEHIAQMLLKTFCIPKIRVKVTKYPLDMPNTKEVAYECVRTKKL